MTIRDVAEASGVSRSTVSFVLNDRMEKPISEATRARVRKAASELGYVPNPIARALAEGVSRVVVLEIGGEREGNYTRSFIRGLDEELARNDHVLLIRHTQHQPPSVRMTLDAIAPRAVIRYGAAYRFADADDPRADGARYMAEDVALQIGYLAERGHVGIAVALPGDAGLFGESHLSFARDEAGRRGLGPVRALLLGTTRAACSAALAALLSDEPTVSAVAAFNDPAAIQVMSAMIDLGLRAPDDLAVIGYDETASAAFLTPPLTTVHIDAEEYGSIVARRALGLEVGDVRRTPASVVIRATA